MFDSGGAYSVYSNIASGMRAFRRCAADFYFLLQILIPDIIFVGFQLRRWVLLFSLHLHAPAMPRSEMLNFATLRL